ncbi:hypothetical protein CRG98_008996 [Punica granatum]|uniref:Uncharacterized protein n=1 Tax=Punica granatum TaxID=22663 RepID=A0A2I0KQ75_PUNGR|nr:hypothetical protein CRG98_008996 [Punica granatum]
MIRSTRVTSRKTNTTATFGGHLGVGSHQPYIKRPSGASYRAFSSSGASRVCFDQTGSLTQPALREKPTQIDRCGPDKSDYQSGLPVDPTAPTRVCSFQGAEPTSQTRFFDFPRLFSHPGVRYNHSRFRDVRTFTFSLHVWSNKAVHDRFAEPEPIGYAYHGVQHPKPSTTGSNTPNHRPRGPTPPCTPSARNLSAEWGLTPSHHSIPSNVYVEDDSDRVCESRLDITRELERTNGYRENRSILVSTVGPVGPDPPLLEPTLL